MDFVIAMNGDRIANAPVSDFKGVIRLVLLKLGVRHQNWPEDEEKGLIIAHIKKEFGTHTLKEFVLAFDLAMGRKLEIPEDKVSCYENFSCAYISQVMVAYRKWAAQTHNQLLAESKPKPIEMKEDLSDQAMRDWLEATRKAKPILQLMPVMLYDWLDKKGEIDKTGKEKMEYIKKAIPVLHNQLIRQSEENRSKYLPDLHAFNEMKRKGEFEGHLMKKLKETAKKLILQEYLFGYVHTP